MLAVTPAIMYVKSRDLFGAFVHTEHFTCLRASEVSAVPHAPAFIRIIGLAHWVSVRTLRSTGHRRESVSWIPIAVVVQFAIYFEMLVPFCPFPSLSASLDDKVISS